ncbi:MAG: hypothetical protein K6D38_04035 [Pseudobutyrivibrio sp.]|nr:hypothetical protein [Pseudobutyrivibrio sp.]
MIKCDCLEKTNQKITTAVQFDEARAFFKKMVEEKIYVEVDVKEPYHTGKLLDGKKVEWFADKWFKCNLCGQVWEFLYPDFPAGGKIRKL